MGERVLVCGGRDFHGDSMIWHALDAARFLTSKNMILIHGGAKGADHHAARWAKNRGVEECVFEPQWDKHGKAAGPIRNQQMIDEGQPTMVIAFPGGNGTADMIRRAEKAGIKVFRIG